MDFVDDKGLIELLKQDQSPPVISKKEKAERSKALEIAPPGTVYVNSSGTLCVKLSTELKSDEDLKFFGRHFDTIFFPRIDGMSITHYKEHEHLWFGTRIIKGLTCDIKEVNGFRCFHVTGDQNE